MEEKIVRKNPFEATENREAVKPKRKEVPAPAVEPIPEEPKAEKPVADKPKSGSNLMAKLTNKKTTGTGCNVYLDADVIEQLDKLAKQAKTSRSRVINTLLREYLLGE